MIYLLQIKNAKTPVFEKLPKDHQFYLHYDQKMGFNRMNMTAQDEIAIEQSKYAMVLDELNRGQRFTANRSKKLVPYE